MGRIHALKVKIGESTEITVSVQILEANNMQFLFGLDNMKRHRCCVDLLENHLKFTELLVSIPFLKAHEIKKEYELTKTDGDLGGSNLSLSRNQSMSQDDKIKSFMSMANIDYEQAKQALEKFNWDIELATQNMLGGSKF